MQTVGDYLKKERVARNISLNDVAEFTKISKTYLDWLEQDEYIKIPGEPYVKGYISSYAECVGISDHEPLKLYDSFQKKKRNAEEKKAEVLTGNKGRRMLPFFSAKFKIFLVLALLITIILTIGGYYTFFHKQEKVSADKRIQRVYKTIPDLSSKNESSLPQERQAGGFLDATKQAGLETRIEDGENRTKYDEGTPQMPAPEEIHQPEKVSGEIEPYPPVDESFLAKDLQDTMNYQTPIKNELVVAETNVCSDIQGRSPQGCGASLEWSTDRVYIWNLIECANPPSSIRHIYYFEGEKVNDIALNINSSHWRTWSYKTLSDKRYIGPWRVDITSADGKLLKTVEFEIR